MSAEQLKELRKLAEDLNHAADTAALILNSGGYPAAGQSLDQHVARMKIFLETPPKVKTCEYCTLVVSEGCIICGTLEVAAKCAWYYENALKILKEEKCHD